MEDMRGAYWLSVGKPDGKVPLGTPTFNSLGMVLEALVNANIEL
jgi:hypothetical protein